MTPEQMLKNHGVNDAAARTVCLVGECSHGQFDPTAFELVECLRRLCNLTGSVPHALVIGENATHAAEEIARDFGIDATAVQWEGSAHYRSDYWLQAIEQMLPIVNPWCVLLPHTPNGMDLAPALAVNWRAACITAVEGVESDHAELCFKRSILGGKISVWMTVTEARVVLTVQPGAFQPAEKSREGQGSVREASVCLSPRRMRFLGIEKGHGTVSGLESAPVVISGGMGMGKSENIPMLQRLASVFPKGAVAGSRPLCDRGWLDYRLQVGLTGATVRPKLYIACGISGSLQHIVGMQDAEFIVAVNSDPNAVIFRYADVGIVEDAVAFLPVLKDRIENYSGGENSPEKEIPKIVEQGMG